MIFTTKPTHLHIRFHHTMPATCRRSARYLPQASTVSLRRRTLVALRTSTVVSCWLIGVGVTPLFAVVVVQVAPHVGRDHVPSPRRWSRARPRGQSSS